MKLENKIKDGIKIKCYSQQTKLGFYLYFFTFFLKAIIALEVQLIAYGQKTQLIRKERPLSDSKETMSLFINIAGLTQHTQIPPGHGHCRRSKKLRWSIPPANFQEKFSLVDPQKIILANFFRKYASGMFLQLTSSGEKLR